MADCTLAPMGIVTIPAGPVPFCEKVCSYEVLPSLNWVSVVAAPARGDITERTNTSVRKIAQRMAATGVG